MPITRASSSKRSTNRTVGLPRDPLADVSRQRWCVVPGLPASRAAASGVVPAESLASFMARAASRRAEHAGPMATGSSLHAADQSLNMLSRFVDGLPPRFPQGLRAETPGGRHGLELRQRHRRRPRSVGRPRSRLAVGLPAPAEGREERPVDCCPWPILQARSAAWVPAA